MSFGIFYGVTHPYYPTLITAELSSQILSEIDPSLDQSLFNLAGLEINFDLENPFDTPCYIDKQEYATLDDLFDKDQFEFINVILWEFLYLNPITKSILVLLDNLIATFPEQYPSNNDLDRFIQCNTRFKSFASYTARIEKDHGINFEEYKAYRQGRLTDFKQQPFAGQKPIHLSLVYKMPILKKISSPVFVEIDAGMTENDILNRIKNSSVLKQPDLFNSFPSKNRVRILYDALTLYKYMNHTNFQFDKALRYYNFHALQVYGVSTTPKHYISLKDRAKSNNLLSNIVTNDDFELTRNKAKERKKVISAIEKALELPKIGR